MQSSAMKQDRKDPTTIQDGTGLEAADFFTTRRSAQAAIKSLHSMLCPGAPPALPPLRADRRLSWIAFLDRFPEPQDLRSQDFRAPCTTLRGPPEISAPFLRCSSRRARLPFGRSASHVLRPLSGIFTLLCPSARAVQALNRQPRRCRPGHRRTRLRWRMAWIRPSLTCAIASNRAPGERLERPASPISAGLRHLHDGFRQAR